MNIHILLVVCVTAVATACTSSFPTSPSRTDPVALRVHYMRATGVLDVGNSRSFKAYLLNRDGVYEDVTTSATWSSSDPQVIIPTTVPPSSAFFEKSFRAVGAGVAEARARYLHFESAAGVAVVLPNLRAYPYIGLTPGDPLRVGDTAAAVARLHESATSSRLITDVATWTSSDSQIVSVERGAVTAVGVGTAHIVVTHDGLSAWYGLSVHPR
jgi:hypothetical protein